MEQALPPTGRNLICSERRNENGNTYRHSNTAAWQQQAGIEPATGERAELLNALSKACFETIKIIELEKSGIRDGAGFWEGSDVIGHVTQELIELCHRLQPRASDKQIDDMDVFDSMRALLHDGVDLDDRATVERQILNPYEDDPTLSKRFIDWCIKSAKANLAAGGRKRHQFGSKGFVPPEETGTTGVLHAQRRL